ncbi:MAG TPA: multicopper oxidase domain-containing protein [Gemmatimonadaceae bacterium]|jgi:nitrite reductase (NO-forming)
MLSSLLTHARRHRRAYRLVTLVLLFVLASLPLVRFGSRIAAGETRLVRSPAETTSVTLAGDVIADPETPFNPIAPPRLAGTMHDLDLWAEEKSMTVAPGVVQRVWTFNGTVPGPVIRIRVGDTVRVHFRNLAKNRVPHSLDFHASEVAWNDQMISIPPGQERTFQWVPRYAGVFMYHCISAPPVLHVASGMFGMTIVEPRTGLPPVDREFAIVQSEWYLGAPGGEISMKKASAAAPAPDYMAFNGVADQYERSPLHAKPGERLRFFVNNAGPNLESSFHIVGMIFNTVLKEGTGLTRDNAGGFGSEAVDLAPAQGAIIEATAPEEGLYPIVTHTFNFHDRGARGLIRVGDGAP